MISNVSLLHKHIHYCVIVDIRARITGHAVAIENRIHAGI